MNEFFAGQRDQLPTRSRCARLDYIAENTQEEIAAKLNVSRQTAQRLVALASQ